MARTKSTRKKKQKGMRPQDMLFFGVLGAMSFGMLGAAYYFSQKSGRRRPLVLHTGPAKEPRGRRL